MSTKFITLILSLMLTSLMATPIANAWPEWQMGQFEQYGPHADNLIFKVYPNPELEYDALEAGEIDWTEWTMTGADYTKYTTEEKSPGDPWSNYIGVADYYERGICQFDLNCNDTFHNRWGLPHLEPYDGKINPTSDVEFRRALNFLVNKTEYVSEVAEGMAGEMQTVLPPPPPFGPFEEYDGYYYDGPPFYTYSPTTAASILDAAGWDDSDGDGNLLPNERNVPSWVHPDRPEISEYLGGGLVFVMRTDKPLWMQWSNMFADEMEAIGIPVLRDEKPMLPAIYQVIVFLSFHVYAGGLFYSTDPSSIFGNWHSDGYRGPGLSNTNYVGYVNPAYDEEAERVYAADSLATAQAAAAICQWILKEDTPSIPLLYVLGAKGYNKKVVSGTHAGKTLGGLVNAIGFGINSWWTKLNARAEDAVGNTLEGGTLVQGLSNDIESMNPISAFMYYDYEVLDVLFDSMVRQDPYSLSPVYETWMADLWQEGLWNASGIMDPTLPGYPWATTITFYLDWNQPPKWSDGERLTAEDVAFTIDFTLKCGPDVAWRYSSFVGIYDYTIIDPNTIQIYFNCQSIFFKDTIGSEYILPKHIWENALDSLGRDWTHPDWDPWSAVYYRNVFAEPQYLTGSGPYKFVEGVPGVEGWIKLEENPFYFHSSLWWTDWALYGDIDKNGHVGLEDLYYILFYYDTNTSDHPTDPGGAPPEADIHQPRNYHIDLFDLTLLLGTYCGYW